MKKIFAYIVDDENLKVLSKNTKFYLDDLKKIIPDKSKLYILDVSSITSNSNINYSKKFNKKEFRYIKIANYKEYLKFLKRHFIIGVLKIPNTYKTYLLQFLFKFFGSKRIMINNRGLIYEYAIKDKLKKKHYNFKNLSIKISYYSYRLLTIIGLLPKYDLYFDANQPTIDNILSGKSKKIEKIIPLLKLSFYKKIYRINSKEYSTIKNDKSKIENKYIVFCDGGFDHFDRTIREGKVNNVTRSNYYKNLLYFLKILSKKFDKKVIYCLHPKSPMPGMYNPKENLNFEQYKKIIDEAASYNCPSISVQGENEPFLDKNYENYLIYANKKGIIDIMTNTNGSAITKKRSQKILDTGITRLRFSLDAFTDETYKKVRVGAIDLDKVKRNIFNFLELKEKGGYKLPIVGVSFCKLSKNIHELEDFKNYWKDKVDLVSIQTYVPPSVNKKTHFDFYTEDQYYPEHNLNFRCNQPFQRIQIRNNEIFPCCYSLVMSDKGTRNYENFLIGNLKTDTIYDAWNSEKMKKLRKLQVEGRLSENPTCLNCAKFTFPTKEFVEMQTKKFDQNIEIN